MNKPTGNAKAKFSSKVHLLIDAINTNPNNFGGYYSVSNKEKLIKWIGQSIVFDCGQHGELPPVRTMDCLLDENFKLPFNDCLIQTSWISDGVTGFNFIIVTDSITRQHSDNCYLSGYLMNLNDANPLLVGGFSIIRDKETWAIEGSSNGDIIPNDFIKHANDQLVDAAGQVLSFIQALSCKNIYTINHDPPIFLNSKRKKKGKTPFFSYKTLHIKTDGKEITKGIGSGTHASPRLHFRRGHVRRLPSGELTWVTQCMVGDKSKGMVMKDYALSTKGENPL